MNISERRVARYLLGISNVIFALVVGSDCMGVDRLGCEDPRSIRSIRSRHVASVIVTLVTKIFIRENSEELVRRCG